MITWVCHRKEFKSWGLERQPFVNRSEEGLTLETSTFLYRGQFTLSTQLIILNCPLILSHRCSITVSLATPKHQINILHRHNGCPFNETSQRLVMIPPAFRKISFWKFLRRDTIFSFKGGKISAWNGDNFVLGIWKYCKGYNSSEKLAISTGTLASCLLTFGAKIFSSFH